MLAFDALEAAVAVWLLKTGLSASKICRMDDKLPQKAAPYVTYKVRTPKKVGGRDEERYTDIAVPLPEEEVLVTIAGQREIVVSVQCFTHATVGAADSGGNYTAKDYLSRAQTALALPSVHDALAAAGLVFIDVQNFADFSEPLGPIGAGRATLDVRFRAVDSATETTTYIETVTPAGTFTPN